MRKIVLFIGLFLSVLVSFSQTDNKTKARYTVTFAHHEIHEGDSYVTWKDSTMSTNDTVCFAFVTPNSNKEAHLLVLARVSGESFFEISESVTYSSGTIYPDFNRNRNSSDTSDVIIVFNPTVLTMGTTIYEEHIGSGNIRGGEARGLSEFLLRRNTKYFIRLVSQANSNDAELILDWYEHRDPRF